MTIVQLSSRFCAAIKTTLKIETEFKPLYYFD